MKAKKIAIIDIDNCSLDLNDFSTMLLLVLVNWIKARDYDAVFFCSHRRLRLFSLQMNNYKIKFVKLSPEIRNKIFKFVLTHNFISAFLEATNLTDKFVAVSTPDDKPLGLGEGYRQRLKPYEEKLVNWDVLPDTSQLFFKPQSEDMFYGEFSDIDKNPQLEQIFQDVKCKYPYDALEIDFFDDAKDIRDAASKIKVPSNCQFRIYQCDPYSRFNGIELRYEIIKPPSKSTILIASLLSFALQVRQLVVEEKDETKQESLSLNDVIEMHSDEMTSHAMSLACTIM